MGRKKLLNLECYPLALPGENRSYGGNAFYVDLVPRSAWFANLRNMLPVTQWRTLSQYVINRAGKECEICGSSTRLEAHERWEFNESTLEQKLVRIICVCKLCHLSIHIGLAGILGIRNEVDSHIRRVTSWSKQDLRRHVEEARNRWERISYYPWEINVSIATNAGLTIYSKNEVRRRLDERNRKLAEKINSHCLFADGLNWDFSDQIHAGSSVFIADEDEEIMDSFPLPSNFSCAPYFAKQKNLIDSSKSTVELSTFIKAYRRIFRINSNEELKQALKDQDGPMRLILGDEVDDPKKEMIKNGLSKGVLFWRENFV